MTIAQVGQLITSLKEDYPGKEVMIFETAYGWTTQNADAANNILFNTHPSYAPLSPTNQKKWMTDLTQTVIDHGGSGVVYWEPAWVSTECATQWVTGSSWDNATFFDFDNAVIADGGIGWMKHAYDFTSSTEAPPGVADGVKIFYSKGDIMITHTSSLHFPCNINVYSMDSVLKKSFTIPASDKEEIIHVSANGLVPGCYLVSIKSQFTGVVSELVCIMNE